MNKLTIIIPYYKIDFFEETLKSVVTQTNRNFTLLIGNDASPDDPLPLIEKYLKKEEYQYFDYKENWGGKNLALQWERILENVTEDWFQILGDDDTISNNFVEEFYKILHLADQNLSNVIKFSQCWINEASEKTNSYTHYPLVSSSKSLWRSKYFEKHRSSLSEHIFRTAVYQKHKFKPMPLAWFSDDLAVLEFSQGKEIIFVDAAKVYVRMSEVNISSKTDNQTEKEIARYQYLEIILNKYSFLFTKEELKNTFDLYLHLIWKNKGLSKLHFLKMYCKTKSWFKIVNIPYIKYTLWINSIKK